MPKAFDDLRFLIQGLEVFPPLLLSKVFVEGLFVHSFFTERVNLLCELLEEQFA